ncbi:hypothetical protein [Arundinibacter roseus]|uniref:Uncharacterized protein n=1 Tax=Arundinibacter roseus TaxID=2070510 RepID=A0A4R4KAC3_9BACT|nr:hypothetical protein [Arundinibacter roseus]TDB63602.1 hypothetical protein EZE20_14945 [Arundinibacter roseus]
MAKGKGSAVFILVIIGAVFAVLSKIIEVIGENIILFGSIAFLALIMIWYVKFIESKNLKKIKEETIYKENIDTIKRKYQFEKNKIEKAVEMFFYQLERLENDLVNLKQETISLTNNYDPVHSIKDLQNILKLDYFKYDVWNLFYEDKKFDKLNINRLVAMGK